MKTFKRILYKYLINIKFITNKLRDNMIVEPNLNFNGNCEEAIKTYEKVFNGKDLKIMKYGDIPENPDFPISEDEKNLVIHAEMKIGETNFNFSDTPQDYVHGNMVSIAIRVDTEKEVKDFFEGLKEDSTVYVELGPTFFSSMYVFFTDKFGVNWQFIAITE